MSEPTSLVFPSSWSVWTASTARGADWEMKEIFSFSNVAEFWSHFNAMKTPSECANVEVAIFRSKVTPDWEQEPCSLGGRWSARLDRVGSNEALDQAWLNLVLAIVGGTLGSVLGVAYSGKGQHSKRVSVWLDSNEKESVLQVGNAVKDQLRNDVTDKDIGEMLFHDFVSGNKAHAVIANTGKRVRPPQQ